jgi:hypothetical protein
MAYFAQLNEENLVTQVIGVANQEILNEQGQESEQKGIDFCTNLLGGTWKQTSYNTQAGQHALGGTPFRKNYAGIGYTYDLQRDAFIEPKPYASWVLDETTCRWKAPVEKPVDDKIYTWDEATTSWVEVPVGE